MIERTYDYRKVKDRLLWGMVISSKVVYLIDGDSYLWAFVPHEEAEKYMEVHVHVEQGSRGKEAVKKCKAAVKWIFDNTDIRLIIGKIPKDNKAACINAVRCGLKFMYETETKRLYEVRN